MKRELVVVAVLAFAFLFELVVTYPRLAAIFGGGAPPTASHALAVAPVATPTPAPDASPAAPLLEIDDATSSGKYGFHYGPGWEHVSGIDDGRTYGTSSRSMHSGAVASLTFVGTGIVLYGVLGPTGGRAYVDVDGAEASSVVHFYAPRKEVDREVFKVDRLPDGIHHLVVTVAKPASDEPTHRYVNIDGVGVTT